MDFGPLDGQRITLETPQPESKLLKKRILFSPLRKTEVQNRGGGNRFVAQRKKKKKYSKDLRVKYEGLVCAFCL